MQGITLSMRPGALLQYQAIVGQEEPSPAYVLFGRQNESEFEVHQLYPFQLFTDKGKVNEEGFAALQQFQTQQNLELFKVGVLSVNNELELPVDTMQLLEAYMQSYEWVKTPLQLWVSQDEIRNMTALVDWVGRKSTSGEKGVRVPIKVKMFNCEEIVFASMLSVLE